MRRDAFHFFPYLAQAGSFMQFPMHWRVVISQLSLIFYLQSESHGSFAVHGDATSDSSVIDASDGTYKRFASRCVHDMLTRYSRNTNRIIRDSEPIYPALYLCPRARTPFACERIRAHNPLYILYLFLYVHLCRWGIMSKVALLCFGKNRFFFSSVSRYKLLLFLLQAPHSFMLLIRYIIHINKIYIIYKSLGLMFFQNVWSILNEVLHIFARNIILICNI